MGNRGALDPDVLRRAARRTVAKLNGMRPNVAATTIDAGRGRVYMPVKLRRYLGYPLNVLIRRDLHDAVSVWPWSTGARAHDGRVDLRRPVARAIVGADGGKHRVQLVGRLPVVTVWDCPLCGENPPSPAPWCSFCLPQRSAPAPHAMAPENRMISNSGHRELNRIDPGIAGHVVDIVARRWTAARDAEHIEPYDADDILELIQHVEEHGVSHFG